MPGMGSGLIWVNGDLNTLTTNLVTRIENVAKYAPQVMQIVVDEAEADMRKIVEAAVTPTGERRVAAGKGVAGRVDSEDMIKDISSNVDEDKNMVTGSWGWLDGFERYYLYQEDGTNRIEPMHALLQSFIQARENLRKRLPDLVHGDGGQ